MYYKPIKKMRSIAYTCLYLIGGIFTSTVSGQVEQSSQEKRGSVFYPAQVVSRARDNAAENENAAQLRDAAIRAAQPWARQDDQALWNLMFGPTITRSWMVWSDGYCPACKQSVPMYNWEIDAMAQPWKLWCPHCGEVFPTNDFAAFYQSGLDEHGVFTAELADRSLLFNADHPDPNDPLHTFGVDDGEGFIAEGNRWRFIGAYLVYGQWKQAVLGGIRNLAAAYVLTGDRQYAHKAAILLDRVADLYPTFDFKSQAVLYEDVIGDGYVSVWHDACEETRELALAYDQIFEGIEADEELVRFLQSKADRFAPANQKNSIGDIRANIEERILRDALANQHKIHSNYPRTLIAVATMEAILAWPNNREQVLGIINEFLQQATAVDGVTGEKGLANYSAFGPQNIALFLAEWDRTIPGFLEDVYARCPRLVEMYRFHIDTWCLGQYYPLVGDTGWFARQIEQYQGVRFQRLGNQGELTYNDRVLAPSTFTFMWRMYQLTGEPAFVQVLYLANDKTVDGLPHDMFTADGQGFRDEVAAVIAEHGESPRIDSVNKEQWNLAILRSGQGDSARAAWLNYGVSGSHRHQDGMNLGLFANGLDLMPDFGYPPVQYGGWDSPRARWYTKSAAHNTVVVDGQDHAVAQGQTTLWAEGQLFQAVRASAPQMIGAAQYERTVATVSLPNGGFYLLDIFRVVGGQDHAKFFHSHFGTISTTGLTLAETEPYGYNTQMRNFRLDPSPQPGWYVDWDIEDRYGILPEGSSVRLRYTDLTNGAQASTAQAWISSGGFDSDITQQAWIPRVMVRRQSGDSPLASTFVAIIEPYEGDSGIGSIRRLTVTTEDGRAYPDSTVTIEVTHADGTQDLILAADAENPLGQAPCLQTDGVLLQPEWNIRLEGQLCLVRRSPDGAVSHVTAANTSTVSVQDLQLRNNHPEQLMEWHAQRAGGAQ